MPKIGLLEVLLIVVVILLLFGANRLPKALGGLGKGVREFKKSLKGDDADDAASDDKKPTDKDA
jgi:sec-independent protein translocase protein TatA